jgi:hypothetical protein
MRTWLRMMITGAVLVVGGSLFASVRITAPWQGVGWAIVGGLLTIAGVWFLGVSAVILGVELADAEPDSRMARIEVLLRPSPPEPEPVPPAPSEAAAAVAEHLRRHPGATFEDLRAATGLMRTEVRLGLGELDQSGQLQDVGGGYRLAN